jgi:SPP1 Gp6-like portal protein
MAVLNLDAYRAGMPLWWVHRLYERLVSRRSEINMWDDYYRGDFPLPWLAPQAADEFRRILKMSRANYMGLVIDAQCERMAVEGFRAPSESDGPRKNRRGSGLARVAASAPVDIHDDGLDGALADDNMQRIWEANSMDTQFDMGLLEAAITGVSYLLVAPNPKDPSLPHMWVEHSSQTIIAYRPGTNRQEAMAALKVYVDEWTGQTFATLYLPDQIWKFATTGETMRVPALPGQSFEALGDLMMPIWNVRSKDGTITGERNPLDLVPLFEVPNNPRLLTGGQSELYDLTDTQDRIVKTIADRLVNQDYGAFPQKWASAWPLEDAAGNPTPPIEVGLTRMVTTEVAETRFGQFAAADGGHYLDAKEADVTDIASRSRTPAQYLIGGSMSNVNGDTLKASESGLVAKVRQRFRGYEPGLENGAMLAYKLAGHGDLRTAGRRLETIWRNPEFRTEGELVDALLKMRDVGVPEEALWERWGATPQEIRRWKRMLEEKMARAAAGDATVILAESFRAAAAGPVEAERAAASAEKVAKAKANGGGANDKGTQPGKPRGTRGPGNKQSGGQSSTSARTRRANAPKPSTT